MKKKFIFWTLLLFTAPIVAQTKGNVEFGFNTGLNVSVPYTGNIFLQPDEAVSFNIGASADYYFSDRWSVKAKLIYDRKGWENGFIQIYDEAINTIVRYTTDYNVNYLTVPVMANWHFGRKRNWYLNFGPYVGFLLNAKETAFDTDVKEMFNTTDAGLALGIGVKIPVTDYLKIFLEYDTQNGLSEIYKSEQGGKCCFYKNCY